MEKIYISYLIMIQTRDTWIQYLSIIAILRLGSVIALLPFTKKAKTQSYKYSQRKLSKYNV